MKNNRQDNWTSGINPKSPMSYERYLKMGLEMIHKNLSVRVYKLAPKDSYPAFQRGKDLRVGFFWKNKPIEDKTVVIKDEIKNYEFIIEQPFWYQSNKNKEDRKYMRDHADLHLKALFNCVDTARKNALKSATKKVKTKKKTVKKKVSVGNTQNLLENFKKDK